MRGKEYGKRRPETWVAFTSDRVCKACGTRYTPPTPVWAGILFIVGGLLLAGFGALSIIGELLSRTPASCLGTVCSGLFGLVGLLMIGQGTRSLLNQGKV